MANIPYSKVLKGEGDLYVFLIVGGLYSVTALRKNNDEGVKVYTKHQDLTQASEHHKQMTMS